MVKSKPSDSESNRSWIDAMLAKLSGQLHQLQGPRKTCCKLSYQKMLSEAFSIQRLQFLLGF